MLSIPAHAQHEALKEELMRVLAVDKDQLVADATAPLLQKPPESEAAVSAAQQVRSCCSFAAHGIFYHGKYHVGALCIVVSPSGSMLLQEAAVMQEGIARLAALLSAAQAEVAALQQTARDHIIESSNAKASVWLRKHVSLCKGLCLAVPDPAEPPMVPTSCQELALVP